MALVFLASQAIQKDSKDRNPVSLMEVVVQTSFEEETLDKQDRFEVHFAKDHDDSNKGNVSPLKILFRRSLCRRRSNKE